MSNSVTVEDHCSFDEVCAFNRRSLFLGGAAKSGTTLLLSLLDGHPRLVVLPEETDFFGKRKVFSNLNSYPAKARWILERTNLRFLIPERAELERKTGDIGPRDYTNFDYPGFARLVEQVASQPGLNDALFFSEVVRAYAIAKGSEWRNCIRWVEKTPGNEVYSDELFKIFPEAKLLQLVRDPRAVFASRKKRLVRSYGRHAKAHRLVREWNRSARQISKLLSRTDRYLMVRYEDLVSNTAATLQKICEFIGIELLPVMLEPTRAGNQWKGNSAYDRAFAGISADSVEQWKGQLTDEEIWWIELHCRKGMQIAGYNFETDCRFSFSRWARRMSDESWGGYVRARRGSLCQWAGLLEDCRYDATRRDTKA